MTEEELENWQAVDYRMRNEGIDYCFEHYSRFEEIKDEIVLVANFEDSTKEQS